MRSVADRAVDRLTQQIGMPEVPGVLLDQMHQNPTKADPFAAMRADGQLPQTLVRHGLGDDPVGVGNLGVEQFT